MRDVAGGRRDMFARMGLRGIDGRQWLVNKLMVFPDD
jgi:hypothetical protein